MLIAASALAFGAYDFLKPTAPASTQISAIPLASSTTTDAAVSLADAGQTATVYALDASQSTASFIVDEVLRGSPYTVVGTTDQVAGQLAFDSTDPSSAQLGSILINARTLTTDDESRTRALGNRILNTAEYEYIAFTPTELTGLPETVTHGEPFLFQATGDLTIKDVTKPATFDVIVTPAADGTLNGTARTTIQYADWGLSIPSVPFVASVDDDVVLQLDFGARATA